MCGVHNRSNFYYKISKKNLRRIWVFRRKYRERQNFLTPAEKKIKYKNRYNKESGEKINKNKTDKMQSIDGNDMWLNLADILTEEI